MPSILPRFDFRAAFGVASDRGSKRESNEDAHAVAPELAVFAVADGMGGHRAGEVAARIAIEEIVAVLGSPGAIRVVERYVANAGLDSRRKVLSFLRRAVELANARVRREALDNPDYSGMGTTLDVVWLARDHAFIAHARGECIGALRAGFSDSRQTLSAAPRAPTMIGLFLARARRLGCQHALACPDCRNGNAVRGLGPRTVVAGTDGVHGS